MDTEWDGLDDSLFGSYVNDEEIDEEEIEEEEHVSIYEDLFHKNTSSFQCLAQVEISRSSLLRDPLYQFPELENPNLDSALWEIPLPPDYDDIGVERYKDLCKKENIVPFRRVLQSLHTETLDLKYYKLSDKAMRTICETLIYNEHVRQLILQENFFTPEVVAYLNPLMEKNTTLRVLDLKQCNLGMFGVEALKYGILKAKGITELDLSHNDLCDEGVEILATVLRKNVSIRKLNLGHNSLSDRALIALRRVLRENRILEDLNLSWNYFYSPIGMVELMLGMAENRSVRSLNLSWNGIGTEPKTFKCIIDYLKGKKTRIQHLNVSNNRISGNLIRQLRRALKFNKTIVSVNIGFNPMSSANAEYLAGTFFDKRKKFTSKLIEIDVGDTYVTKEFKPKLARIQEKGCTFKYGGIISDYEIEGPDFKKLLLNRGKFICATMKKKKQRIDIGHLIITFQEDDMKKYLFNRMLKDFKIKWDEDLTEQITKEFRNEKKRVNLQLIKQKYLEMYPDTKPAPPKKKKGRRRKKKANLEEDATVQVQTSQTVAVQPSQTITTQASQMTTVSKQSRVASHISTTPSKMQTEQLVRSLISSEILSHTNEQQSKTSLRNTQQPLSTQQLIEQAE